MHKIEIDDEVQQALALRARGIGVSHNDVLRSILGLDGPMESGKSTVPSPVTPPKNHPILDLIAEARYRNGDGKDRYFQILKFLYDFDKKTFENELEAFCQRRRVFFSRRKEAIEKSGRSTKPEVLAGTPFYVLTNLSNGRKRRVLDHVLRYFKIPEVVISKVTESIPDAVGRRSVNHLLDGYDL